MPRAHTRGRSASLTAAAAALAFAFALAGPPSSAHDAAAPRTVRGVVFDDTNRDGRRDAGEAGIGSVVVSDQRSVVVTAADGRYEMALADGASTVFVSLPDGFTSRRFWKAPDRGADGIDFALERRPAASTFTFLHASDTHLSEKSVPRIRLLKEVAAKERVDFVILTGDLVRDALRVPEAEARGYYELVKAELSSFPVPVFTVPGNHELFGIERHLSLVSRDHPLYGRAMYRSALGPDFFSFDWGGVHFVGLNTVDNDDLWYYGHVDAAQMAWLEKDLAHVRKETPVVTFNHIPLATAIDVLNGYTDEPPAPTLIRVNGRMQYRHVVSNTADVLAKIAPHRLEIALGGHMHARETLALETSLGRVRFHQTGAVVGPSEAAGLTFPSGVTLYRVKDGRVDDGTFLPLDRDAPKR